VKSWLIVRLTARGDLAPHRLDDVHLRDIRFTQIQNAASGKLPRSGRGIVENHAHDFNVGKNWGRSMTAGDYLAAAVLIALIVWGAMGVLTQDKFRL
jgi:hypothetical protein